MYLFSEAIDYFRKKAADKRAIKREDKTTKALKRGDPAELERLRKEVEFEKKLTDQLRSSKATDKAKAKMKDDLKRIKAAEAEAAAQGQAGEEGRHPRAAQGRAVLGG